MRDVGRLTQLIALTGPDGGWRKTIVDKAIASVCLMPCCQPKIEIASRWSAKNSECPAGDPGLHHYIGDLLYKGSSKSESLPIQGDNQGVKQRAHLRLLSLTSLLPASAIAHVF